MLIGFGWTKGIKYITVEYILQGIRLKTILHLLQMHSYTVDIHYICIPFQQVLKNNNGLIINNI